MFTAQEGLFCMVQKLGRWSELNNEVEVSQLEKGMDFREPRYRREVFLRFYEFHLKHRSHPGGVYFAMPWIANKFGFDFEQKLWMAFINGCSQNIVTTWKIFQNFPSIKNLDLDSLNDWWNSNHTKFKSGSGWDSDRKYHKIGKTGLVESVASYKKQLDKFSSQQEMFESKFYELHGCGGIGTPYKNFDAVWDFVRKDFLSFGRLSTFSYLEYLRIQGLKIECSSLFLDDIGGSRSHRNGLCKVLGRDDLDWWDHKESHNPNFGGYEKETIAWLVTEAEILLEEAKIKIRHKDVNYFTMESAFCTYKSWHRPNRRYPNVYMDMMHDRIRYAESQWGPEFDIFWEMRKECLPSNLLLEENPADPGVKSDKQNHYRNTGQVIMMDKEWDCFENDFNNRLNILNVMFSKGDF